ncbi:hypothetical protein PoB_001991200 [Plakobranchus ocellatus]|uniref:Uncharacterized protein n=1 Tax=Plakobranchus ocellatus TaxID=259542 RepID=A0AAV3ZDQ9_9GAST|nr:hypothetical protein PoB_001991200 [Plakobranchus ocellatus]
MNSKPLLFVPESPASAFTREARDAEPAASANGTEAPLATMTSAEMDSSTSASLNQNTTSTSLLSTVIPKGPSTVDTNGTLNICPAKLWVRFLKDFFLKNSSLCFCSFE